MMVVLWSFPYPFTPLSMTFSIVEAAQHSAVVSVEIKDDINFISRFLSNQDQTLYGGEIITWAAFFTHVILALFFISFGIYMCTYIPGIFLDLRKYKHWYSIVVFRLRAFLILR